MEDEAIVNVLELFAGTKSFSNVARQRGHSVFTSDHDKNFNTNYTVNILQFNTSEVPFIPDVIWASPPCESFSVASIGKHWNRDNTPKTKKAQDGVDLVIKTIDLINEFKPKYWIIENPRGKLRKLPMMKGMRRYTVTYCQYGDSRMKPTDLWTNFEWFPKKMCKNGDPCHVSAPRGSKTGTQGIKTYRDRSVVPRELCEDILQCIE